MSIFNFKPKHFSPIRIGIITVLVLIITSTSFLIFTLIPSSKEQTFTGGKNIVYTISNDATSVQKEAFEELKIALNSPENTDQYGLDVSSAVVKNYIADFYTWTNKEGTQDVGGLQYVYGPSIQNIFEHARAYFYKDLSYFIDTYGKDTLLEVDSVKIHNAAYVGPYTYNSTEYTTYYVEASWTYKNKSGFDTSTYQTQGKFSLLVNEDGKFEIFRYIE